MASLDQVSMYSSVGFCEIPYSLRDGQFAQLNVKERITELNIYILQQKLVALTEQGKKVEVSEVDPLLSPAFKGSLTHIYFLLTQLSDGEYKAYWRVKIPGGGISESKQANSKKNTRLDHDLERAIIR